MTDLLIGSCNDDVFWTRSERTEAQACEAAAQLGPWMINFIGSRLQSVQRSPGRVMLIALPGPAFDGWSYGCGEAVPIRNTWAHLVESTGGWDNVGTCIALVIKDIVSSEGWGANTSPHRPPSNDPPVDSPLADVLSTVDDELRLDDAINEVKNRLMLSEGELQAATGLSRSTLWRLRSDPDSGRRSTTEAAIWRLHALSSALVRVLGADGTRHWLSSGDPSPISLLNSGHVSEVERAADRLLFPRPRVERSFAGVDDSDYPAAQTAHRETTTHVAPPLPRRARRAPSGEP
jgi:hypothetical protein